MVRNPVQKRKLEKLKQAKPRFISLKVRSVRTISVKKRIAQEAYKVESIRMLANHKLMSRVDN